MRVGIIGAGPVGLTMALHLKRFGIAFRLLEKSRRVQGKLIRTPSSTLS